MIMPFANGMMACFGYGIMHARMHAPFRGSMAAATICREDNKVILHVSTCFCHGHAQIALSEMTLGSIPTVFSHSWKWPTFFMGVLHTRLSASLASRPAMQSVVSSLCLVLSADNNVYNTHTYFAPIFLIDNFYGTTWFRHYAYKEK